MKKLFLLMTAVILAASCAEKQPEEYFVPKDSVEFSGNAFSLFSLADDIRLFTSQNPDNAAEWTLQAVVPLRKESANVLQSLAVELTPLDERGIRVRDEFTLVGEDLQDLLPVFNSGEGIEKSVVFSIPETGKQNYTRKEADDLIRRIKGARLNFNVADTAPEVAVEAEEEKKDEPLTLNSLLTKHGVYGLLARYDRLLKNKDKKGAKKVEDQLWAIEKQVGNDKTIPEWLRKRFKDYIEDKEDEIEDRY